MTQILTALATGVLFGFGLSLSELINPARVIGFLDVTGKWDATLLCVMGGALVVTAPFYPPILRRPRPLLDRQFFLPTKSAIDRPLIVGAAIFGIGWGLGGFCPGPALAALASGSSGVIFFVIAMIAGQRLASRFTD